MSCQAAVTQHTEDVECTPIKVVVMLDNGHETICSNYCIYLDSNGILGISPKDFTLRCNFIQRKNSSTCHLSL